MFKLRQARGHRRQATVVRRLTHTFWIDDKSTAHVARGAELDAEGPHQPEKREKQRTGSGPDHDHARNDPCSPSNRGARLGNRHPQIE